MRNIEISDGADLCNIVENCNTPTERQWNCDSAALGKVLQQTGDFAIKLGMLEALNNLILNVKVVDGKPRLVAYVSLDGVEASAHKIVDSDMIGGGADCSYRLKFSDDGVAELTVETMQ